MRWFGGSARGQGYLRRGPIPHPNPLGHCSSSLRALSCGQVGGRRDTWVMNQLHADWEGKLKLGALPLPLFTNGHGYFVQSAHVRLGLKPFAVHATYSLDYHDGHAKAQRFREAGMWGVEPDEYYTGRYLAVNASTPLAVSAALARFAASNVPQNNIGTHAAALAAYLVELRDALALAKALGRVLILPRWMCYCDKLWSGSDNILGMKVSTHAATLPYLTSHYLHTFDMR